MPPFVEGRWKVVRAWEDKPWELHDLETDRTELTDVADQYPEIVQELDAAYVAWSERIGVRPVAEVKAAMSMSG